MLSPRDITNRQFSKTRFGGYKPEEVNQFLVEMAEDYSRILNEKKDLERQVKDVLTQLDQFRSEQDSLSAVLVGAQKMADNIIREAQGQSEIIQREAEVRADKLLESAHRQLEQEKKEYASLKEEVSSFKSTILGLYKTHLELVTSLPEPKDYKTISPERKPESIASNEDSSYPNNPFTDENYNVSQSTNETIQESEVSPKRRGFVPNLDSAQGFSFNQAMMEESQSTNNEATKQASYEEEFIEQEEFIPMDETNMLDIENSQEYQAIQEENKSSKFGKLQFGQNYQIIREDERSKKKKRR